jgi:hypothetical protein
MSEIDFELKRVMNASFQEQANMQATIVSHLETIINQQRALIEIFGAAAQHIGDNS